MDVIRWGILGAANFARREMAPAIHAAKGARLQALATSDLAKAAPFLDFCPDLRLHASYEALLADPEIDAVYLPLPNHLHVEWSLKALAAGKAVLCEKPMALKASDFDRLIAARDASGLLAAEAYMVVHHPQWQRARRLVGDGAIGQLENVRGAFCYNNPDPANIRNRPETGGGAMRDIGVYPIGTMRFVTGAMPEVIDWDVTWENEVDVTSRARARSDSFAFDMLLSMRLCPFQEMVFHGDKGVLRVPVPFNANSAGEARIELLAPDGTITIERWPAVNQYVLQVEAFGESLRNGTPYPCPLEFSRGTEEMIDAFFAAAGKG
ncbi:Gfo/Idh/MocA family protein [Tropicimonas sp. IMCC34043]|uniref:Gfo/Idh/MocA family protein n=1 Tax=Tropicimonas sp. IMCC34043 TaxID=2248760 RepID=UPI000E2305AB|nr:Gfo/Idh/MocA family oxidoreductase [Tropicimonas sp. IMCC34043]